MKNKQQSKDTEAKRESKFTFRSMDIEVVSGEAGSESPSVRMTVTSETPVLEYIEFNGQYMWAYRILDHSEKSIDRSRCSQGLVILDKHNGDQVALIKTPSIIDRKFGGLADFCTGERAQDIAQDAIKGLRRNTSAGFIVDSSSQILEGDLNGYPLVRAMFWTPYEGSFEPIPADTNTGVGRGLNEKQPPLKDGDNQGERNMTPKQMAELAKRANENGVGDKLAGIMEANETFEAASRALDGEIITAQRGMIQSLKTNATAKVDPVAQRTIAPIGGDIQTQEKLMRKYSLLKVVRSLAGDKDVDVGFEREISQDCRKYSRGEEKGIIIPFCALAKRDFSVAGTSSATVETMLAANEFIDVLKERYLLGQLGVQFMPGVVGNISIPRMSAGTTCYHVAEGGDITESQPTLDNVTGTPHTIGTLVDVTRRMMLQSTPNAEMMLRNEIMDRIMLGVQDDVYAGTGSDGLPSAITTATGINNPSVTQGTPTYAEILNFIGSIEADNAAADSQKWAMTAEVMVKLATTMRNATYGEIPILDPEKPTMLGRQWFTSEGLPANSLWFGNWASVVIPMWGAGIEIASDTAKLFASGGLTLRALLDFDVMVRQGKALAYSTTVTS